MSRLTLCFIIAISAIAAVAQHGLAERPQTRMTVIEVETMHCDDCAREIASHLYRVPGVVGVSTNLDAQRVFIDPQQNIDPAPRAMWEAIESAGYEPVRLAGPFGVFTTKPR